MVQTAEGGAQSIQNMLQRMRELAVQANSGTLTQDDKALLDEEFQQLIEEVTRTAQSTKFNNLTLLDGSTTQLLIQVGPGATSIDTITVSLSALTAGATSIAIDSLSISTDTGAASAISAMDDAITTLSQVRAKLGAIQNRLESAIETLQIQSENLTAAESRIRDVDMAREMATFTKYQILQQASTAMLAQANMSTQSILSLLR